MCDNDYISRVLSRTSGSKRRKKLIEAELFDHIDEHTAFYKEIGYDSDIAYAKSQEDMGDADVVADQLSQCDKSRNLRSVMHWVLIALSCLSLIALLVHDYIIGSNKYGAFSFSYDTVKYFFGTCDFYSYLLSAIVLVLGFFNLFVGIRRKKILNIIVGFATAEFVTLVGPYTFQYMVLSLVRGKTDFIYQLFLSGTCLYDIFGDIYNTVITFVLAVVVGGLFVCGMAVTVRTRRLCNTRRDIRAARVAAVVSAVMMLVAFCVGTYFVADTYAIRNIIADECRERLAKSEQIVIDNAEQFRTTDKDAFKKALQDNFSDNKLLYYYYVGDDLIDDPDFAYSQLTEEDYFDEFLANISASIDTSYDDGSAESSIFIAAYIFDPFRFNEHDIPEAWSSESYYANSYNPLCVYADVSGRKFDVGTSVKEIPLPASFDFSYNQNGDTIIRLTYDYPEYREMHFRYDPDKQDFFLYYDTGFDYTDVDSFTYEQTKIFDACLRDTLCDNDYLYKEIYNIGYNESADIYRVEFSCASYEAQLSGTEYYVSNMDVSEHLLYDVRFENGECIVLFESYGTLQGISTRKANDLYEKATEQRGEWRDFLAVYHNNHHRIPFGVFAEFNSYYPLDAYDVAVEKTIQSHDAIYTLSNGNLYVQGSAVVPFARDEFIAKRTKVASGVLDFDACSGVVMYVDKNSTLYAFGRDYDDVGILLGKKFVTADKPLKVLENVSSFSLGVSSACAIVVQPDAKVFTNSLMFWGESKHGESGLGKKDRIATPTKVGDDIDDVLLVGKTMLYITTTGDLYGVGDNSHSVIGNGQEGSHYPQSDQDVVLRPYHILSDCASVSASGYRVTAVRYIYDEKLEQLSSAMPEQEIYSWGEYGDLKPTPVQQKAFVMGTFAKGRITPQYDDTHLKTDVVNFEKGENDYGALTRIYKSSNTDNTKKLFDDGLAPDFRMFGYNDSLFVASETDNSLRYCTYNVGSGGTVTNIKSDVILNEYAVPLYIKDSSHLVLAKKNSTEETLFIAETGLCRNGGKYDPEKLAHLLTVNETNAVRIAKKATGFKDDQITVNDAHLVYRPDFFSDHNNVITDAAFDDVEWCWSVYVTNGTKYRIVLIDAANGNVCQIIK